MRHIKGRWRIFYYRGGISSFQRWDAIYSIALIAPTNQLSRQIMEWWICYEWISREENYTTRFCFQHQLCWTE